MKLTKASVAKLTPQAARTYVFDPDLLGFGVVVQSSGAKSRVVEYRRKGRGAAETPVRA